MNNIVTLLVVELVVLVALARMGCVNHYIAVLVASFFSMVVYGDLGKDQGIFEAGGAVYFVPALFLFFGGRFLWLLVNNPAAALDAVDTYVMEESVAKQLARGERGHMAKPSFGNWRVAQEVVRNLKGRNKE